MPLTEFQSKVARLLSENRTEDSFLAGGAALHFEASSLRYSLDLDYFHDSDKRVASAFQSDKELLENSGYSFSIELNQPGYIRCLVKKNSDETKIEWAHDSSWRFMPVLQNSEIGYYLHPIDLAINKTLALAGRDEPRDYLDTLHCDKNILPLGAMVWAACGKDPGFNPISLLEQLKRRGRYRPEDFSKLMLHEEIDLQELKQQWLKALDDAEQFVRAANPEDVGCLYYSNLEKKFIQPDFTEKTADCIQHFGRPGGVLPKVNAQTGSV